MRKGHLSTMQILLSQQNSLAKATAVLRAAVQTSGGGLWEAPIGLTRKDLERWEGEQVARVEKLKRSIERQRGGLDRRGVKQRKQGGHLQKDQISRDEGMEATGDKKLAG